MTCPVYREDGVAIEILLIHGYNDTAAIWNPLIQCAEELAHPGSVRFHAIQLAKLPGAESLGSAQILEGFCEQVEQAIQLRRHEPGKPWMLVGHSMGGAIAELVAARGKVPVSALLLLTPAPLAGVPLGAAVMARFQAGYRQRNLERARASREAMTVNLSPQGIEALVRASFELDPELVHQQLIAWTGGHRLGAAPSTVSCGVCLVTTEDLFFKKDMLEGMASRFERVAVMHIPHAGHWVHVEQTRAVAEVLMDHVSKSIEAPNPGADQAV